MWEEPGGRCKDGAGQFRQEAQDSSHEHTEGNGSITDVEMGSVGLTMDRMCGGTSRMMILRCLSLHNSGSGILC